MQHDHVLQKLNIDPQAGSGGVGSVGKIVATMLLHFVITFRQICKMTVF